jgi:hypothetical protein
MAELTRRPVNTDAPPSPGPFLAKIISHLDPTYMGMLEVQLLHAIGNDPGREGQLHQVKYMSPFYGVTSVDYTAKDPDNYHNTQKSYGMWMIPPDVGTTVVVMFIDGDPKKGYWIGCVQDENMNFMVPGYASSKFAVEDSKSTDKERVPVAEYNKSNKDVVKDVTKYEKPATPMEKVLEEQGLLADDIRGITTSSARREVPSAVFGISTPGPIDKQPGAKQGNFGKFEHKVVGGFVSRLGGSSFVMDDGDDKFIRKKKAHEGPMEYSAVEQGETEGEVTIPHNELIRLRTRTGHQILLHNSEDLIYIGNARGTSWIQMSSDGKIDIFAEDSINIRTKQDFNFYCDRDFNLEVGRNFNTKVHGERHTQIIKDDVLIVDRDQKIHVKRRKDETIDEQFRQTVNDDVKMYYAKAYTHNVDGRSDYRIAEAYSFTVGAGESGASFAPYDSTREDPEDPCANDEESSSPVEDHNGETPNRIDIKFYKDTRIECFENVDTTITGDLKEKVKGTVNINTDSTWSHTSTGNINIKSSGSIFTTSAGSNETKAGGNIVETAPQIHMNGPGAGTAETALIAELPEDARVTAKSTIPLVLKTHSLPDIPEDVNAEPEEVNLIMRRMPTHEPYPHHENLDPEKFKPDQTSRDIDDRYKENSETIKEPAETWKKYSTKTDTFEKIGQ